MKIVRIIKRLIFGKPHRIGRVPSISELQYISVRGITNWKIKYITIKDLHRLLSNSWFLVNSYYQT